MEMVWAICLLAFGDPISQKIGNVQIKPVGDSGRVDVPYLVRGADVPMFMANGVGNPQGSYFKEFGLEVRLVPGDDFPSQVRRYLEGETPYLRGTLGMIAIASEAIGNSTDARPRVILQCGWSLGDHLIARKNTGKIDQIKGKSVAVQYGSPQSDFLENILRTNKINPEDITIKWCKSSGDAAEEFRKGQSDLCCVGCPEMLAITGGAKSEGSGAEGTILGASVLLSSQQMEHSIADVLAVREDYYKKNRSKVESLVSGYLKSANELVLSKGSEKEERLRVLSIIREVFGKEIIPELETDAAEFLEGVSFSGLPGQVAFFNDPSNPIGFAAKMREAIDSAIANKYLANKTQIMPADFDYQKIAEMSGLDLPGGKNPGKDQDEILSFAINFQPNQTEFDAKIYGSDFQKVLDSLIRYSDSAMIIEGHSDTNEVLKAFVKSGLALGIITKQGETPNVTYLFEDEPLDLSRTRRVQELVLSGAFDRNGDGPRAVMQAALNLSQSRATSVKSAIIEYAKQNKIEVDPDRIRPRGMGITSPIIPIPRKSEDALQNMRVVFRLVRTK